MPANMSGVGGGSHEELAVLFRSPSDAEFIQDSGNGQEGLTAVFRSQEDSDKAVQPPAPTTAVPAPQPTQGAVAGGPRASPEELQPPPPPHDVH